MLVCLAAAACSRGPGTLGPPAIRFALAADPRTLDPLFLTPDAASVEQQAARLAFEPFVDLDASGRAVPALLAVIPTRANGRSLGRRPDDPLPAPARRALERRAGGDRAGRPLHAARDPRPAQPGALDRRLRPRSTARTRKALRASCSISAVRGRRR